YNSVEPLRAQPTIKKTGFNGRENRSIARFSGSASNCSISRNTLSRSSIFLYRSSRNSFFIQETLYHTGNFVKVLNIQTLINRQRTQPRSQVVFPLMLGSVLKHVLPI